MGFSFLSLSSCYFSGLFVECSFLSSRGREASREREEEGDERERMGEGERKPGERKLNYQLFLRWACILTIPCVSALHVHLVLVSLSGNVG